MGGPVSTFVGMRGHVARPTASESVHEPCSLISLQGSLEVVALPFSSEPASGYVYSFEDY